MRVRVRLLAPVPLTTGAGSCSPDLAFDSTSRHPELSLSPVTVTTPPPPPLPIPSGRRRKRIVLLRARPLQTKVSRQIRATRSLRAVFTNFGESRDEAPKSSSDGAMAMIILRTAS